MSVKHSDEYRGPMARGGEHQKRRLPIVRCPVCNHRAHSRSSDEISPETRRLYYACSNVLCGMTWSASLTVERVISPSGISPHFRPAVFPDGRAPGRDYGQEELFAAPPATPPPTADTG